MGTAPSFNFIECPCWLDGRLRFGSDHTSCSETIPMTPGGSYSLLDSPGGWSKPVRTCEYHVLVVLTTGQSENTDVLYEHA